MKNEAVKSTYPVTNNIIFRSVISTSTGYGHGAAGSQRCIVKELYLHFNLIYPKISVCYKKSHLSKQGYHFQQTKNPPRFQGRVLIKCSQHHPNLTMRVDEP